MIFARRSRSASACFAIARCICSGMSTCFTSTLETLMPHGSVSVSRMIDRKSTRLNSSHGYISYAVFFLKKKTRLNSSHGYISYAVFCLNKKNASEYRCGTHTDGTLRTRASTHSRHLQRYSVGQPLHDDT